MPPPPDHVAVDAPSLSSAPSPQQQLPGGAARLRANAAVPRSPPPPANGRAPPSPTARRAPVLVRPSALAATRRRRALLAAATACAVVVVVVLLLLLRRGGQGGGKGNNNKGGGRGGGSVVVAWPPERAPAAGRAAAKLTATVLSLPLNPPGPATSSEGRRQRLERPAVLYPGIELDADERGDGGGGKAVAAAGGKSVDDDDAPSAAAAASPPLLVSPAAVARLRALTTGLAPDEPDDVDEEYEDGLGSSKGRSRWPPARAYARLLAAAGQGPPPATKKKRGGSGSFLRGGGGGGGGSGTKTKKSTPPPGPVDPRDPDAASYLDPDGPLMEEMGAQLEAVRRHLASPAFAAAQARRRASGPARGIVLNAGGPRLLASAVVLLAVLREHLNVTLPVELAWWGGGEMDGATLAALERRFAPLRGYDLSTLAYPSHHRPLRPSEAALVVGRGGEGGGGSDGDGGGEKGGGGASAKAKAGRRSLAAPPAPAAVLAGTPFDGGDDPDSAAAAAHGGYIHNIAAKNHTLSLKERLQKLRGHNGNNNANNGPPEQGATRRRFAGKVFSLYASRFQRALVLDADCVPLSREGLLALFDDPAFLRRGTLFFPDFWAKEETGNRRAAELAGADADAARRALGRGMAGLPGRDTESGQFLVDLNRHADAVEHLWWLNSYPEQTYRAVWGDKDTYAAAFAGAGKARCFAQSGVPPGGLFAWRPRMLMRSGDTSKDAGSHLDGWMLLGMLQFAPRTGLPLFMHRTIDKFSADGGGSPAAAASARQLPADDAGAAAEREDLLRDPEHLPPHLRRRYADSHPWPVQLATGPLPGRWVRYYLSHEALGPTRGVPWDYVVPSWSVREWLPFPPAGSAARVVEAGEGIEAAAGAAAAAEEKGSREEGGRQGRNKAERGRPKKTAGGGGPAFVSDAWQEAGEGLLFPPGQGEEGQDAPPEKDAGGLDLDAPAPPRLTCPVATYVAYRRARELGLPAGRNATLDAACGWVLRALWGRERWRAFSALGLDERPELVWSAARDPDAAAWSRPAPTLARGGASMLKPGGGLKGSKLGRRRRRRGLVGEAAGAGEAAKDDEQKQEQQHQEPPPPAGDSVYTSAGLFSREVPGPLPVAALRWDYAAPRVDSEPLRALRAAYSAQRALAPGGARHGEFPLLVAAAAGG